MSLPATEVHVLMCYILRMSSLFRYFLNPKPLCGYMDTLGLVIEALRFKSLGLNFVV